MHRLLPRGKWRGQFLGLGDKIPVQGTRSWGKWRRRQSQRRKKEILICFPTWPKELSLSPQIELGTEEAEEPGRGRGKVQEDSWRKT